MCGRSHFNASSSCLAMVLYMERLWDWAKDRSSAMVKTPTENKEQTLLTHIMDWKIPRFSLKNVSVYINVSVFLLHYWMIWQIVTHSGFTWKAFAFIVLNTLSGLALSKENKCTDRSFSRASKRVSRSSQLNKVDELHLQTYFQQNSTKRAALDIWLTRHLWEIPERWPPAPLI